MGNIATITLPKPITLDEYHEALRDTLQATFGDSLILNADPKEPGVNVVCQPSEFVVFQWWYESPTEIHVDHRRGDVSYWISDRMVHHLATKLGATTVQEDAREEPEDLSVAPPVYFLDYYARDARLPVDKVEELAFRAYSPYFSDALSKFWKSPS